MGHRIKNRLKTLYKITIMILLMCPPIIATIIGGIGIWLDIIVAITLLFYGSSCIWDFMKPEIKVILSTIVLFMLLSSLTISILVSLFFPGIIIYALILLIIIDISITTCILLKNIKRCVMNKCNIFNKYHIIFILWWLIQVVLVMLILPNQHMLINIGISMMIIIYLLLIYVKSISQKIKKWSSYIMFLLLLIADVSVPLIMIIIIQPIIYWIEYLCMFSPFINTAIIIYYIVQISKVKELQKTNENSIAT